MKHFFLLALLLWPGSGLRAQRYLIEKATSQVWGGGPTFCSGVRYCLQLRSEAGLLAAPDSIWLRGKSVGLSTAAGNLVRSELRGRTLCEIFFSLPDSYVFPIDLTRPVAQRRPPQPYAGAALLGYRHQGEWRYVEVPAFEKLPELNYP
jgi:hypothetical protein